MKKAMAMALALGLLVLSFKAGDFVKSEFETVETCALGESAQEYVIYASGNLEEASQRDIVLQIPVIAKTIEAQIGEYVRYSQRLAIIDKEKTTEALKKQLSESLPSESDSTVVQAISSLGISLSGDVKGILEQIQQELAAQSGAEAVSQDMIPDEITSPISGYITAINLSQDTLSSASDAVITISSSTALVARVAVNESNIPHIQTGMEATITGAGFDGKEYTGKVSQIYPTARQVLSGTSKETVVDVLIRLDEADDAIKPGYSVQARIRYQDNEVIPCIPYEAVLQDDSGQEYVYVFKEGQAVKKYIVTGRELSDGFEVIGGLTKGDIVIKSSGLIKKSGQYVYLGAGAEKEASGS